MIEYRKGNLITSKLLYIAHGCNMQGVMGAGIAAQIKRAFPYAYEAYIKAYNRNELKLGRVIVGYDGYYPMVFNCITQEYYGKDGKQYASYEALEQCIRWIDGFVPIGCSVGMPRIGAGLGGLEWEKASSIIEKISTRFTPIIYELN